MLGKNEGAQHFAALCILTADFLELLNSKSSWELMHQSKQGLNIECWNVGFKMYMNCIECAIRMMFYITCKSNYMSWRHLGNLYWIKCQPKDRQVGKGDPYVVAVDWCFPWLSSSFFFKKSLSILSFLLLYLQMLSFILHAKAQEFCLLIRQNSCALAWHRSSVLSEDMSLQRKKKWYAQLKDIHIAEPPCRSV